MSAPDRRGLVDRGHVALSLRRQCVLLGVAGSGVYRPPRAANDDDPGLMCRVDELFLAWPFLGSRRIADPHRICHAANGVPPMRQSPRQRCKRSRTRSARGRAATLAMGALIALALPATAFAAEVERSAAPTQLALFGSSDPCDAQHDALKGSDDFFGKGILQALVASGIGDAIGGIFGGNSKGGLASGAAGGLLAYYSARQQQAGGNIQALAEAIGGDARNYGVAMDKASAALEALKQCRMNQAAAIKADYASGRISRGEAQERLAKAHERFKDELETADHLGAQMNHRQEEMQAASDQLLASDPQARSLVTGMDEGPSPPSGETTVEIARNGVLREGPAAYTRSIVTLQRGDTVIVAGPNQGDWIPVRLVDGRTGYVNSQAFKRGAAPAAPPPRQETRRETAKEALAKAPPASKATVETVEATRSNLKRRESYGNEVKTAQNDSQTAFNMN
jgi:hypothetical protein